jgi:hypothetical protein
MNAQITLELNRARLDDLQQRAGRRRWVRKPLRGRR